MKYYTHCMWARGTDCITPLISLDSRSSSFYFHDFSRIFDHICLACAFFCWIPNLQASTDGQTERQTHILIWVGLGNLGFLQVTATIPSFPSLPCPRRLCSCSFHRCLRLQCCCCLPCACSGCCSSSWLPEVGWEGRGWSHSCSGSRHQRGWFTWRQPPPLFPCPPLPLSAWQWGQYLIINSSSLSCQWSHSWLGSCAWNTWGRPCAPTWGAPPVVCPQNACSWNTPSWAESPFSRSL